MEKRLSHQELDFLDAKIASVSEMIDEYRNSSSPTKQELGKELSIILSSFQFHAFDAETYLKKIDETINTETSADSYVNFQEVLYGDYVKNKNRLELGYEFEGDPVHPEFFSITVEEGDRFAGKEGYKVGRFKYICPKIGGQTFSFKYCTNFRKNDGDFWIEFADMSKLGLLKLHNCFDLRLIQNGKLYSMRSNGVLLSALLSMAPESEDYELAFVDGHVNQNGEFQEFGTKPLSKDEIAMFKSYIRAFAEALEGKEQYTVDLEKFISQQPDITPPEEKGWFGKLILPIVAALGAFVGIKETLSGIQNRR